MDDRTTLCNPYGGDTCPIHYGCLFVHVCTFVHELLRHVHLWTNLVNFAINHVNFVLNFIFIKEGKCRLKKIFVSSKNLTGNDEKEESKLDF